MPFENWFRGAGLCLCCAYLLPMRKFYLPSLALVGALLTAQGCAGTGFDEQFDRIRRTASPRELYTFFYRMPKGGILHLHSEYAVSPEFWWTVATSTSLLQGNEYWTKVQPGSCPDGPEPVVLFTTVQRATWRRLSQCQQKSYKPLRSLSEKERSVWLSALRLGAPQKGRREFFSGIVPRLDELGQDPNVMLAVIPEMIKEAATEHVTYLELQFDPTSLHDAAGQPVAPDPFVEQLKERLTQPDVLQTGVTVRFQRAAYRYAKDPDREVQDAFQFVDHHRDLWVGVNLLGEEGRPGGALSRFAGVLQQMRSRYAIPFSLHAGELDTPGPEVREALLLGASRIGHAVNLSSDPETMQRMRQAQVPIEISLVSNYLLQYTPDLVRHPFSLYLRSGIPICLNTDDPGAWDGSLTDEFFLAATLYGLRWSEIVAVVHNSLQYAFVDEAIKTRLLARLDHDLFDFEQRFSADDWQASLQQLAPLSGFAKHYRSSEGQRW